MPGRKFSAANSEYRYGFNGQENSDEIIKGLTTAKYWEYDSRIGRRWNIDPVITAWESPYLCFSGNPIWLSDVNGDKGKPPYDWEYARRWVNFEFEAMNLAYHVLIERQIQKDFNWDRNANWESIAKSSASQYKLSSDLSKNGFSQAQFVSRAMVYYKKMQEAFNWSRNKTMASLNVSLSQNKTVSGSSTLGEQLAIRTLYHLPDDVPDNMQGIINPQADKFYAIAIITQAVYTSGYGSGIFRLSGIKGINRGYFGSTYFRSQTITPNIALGVRETLDAFATKVGGTTWKNWGTKNFQYEFLATINNPSNKIHFNLDGIPNVMKATADGAKGFGKSEHVTSWELYQIRSNPNALERTTFYLNGKVVPSPF